MASLLPVCRTTGLSNYGRQNDVSTCWKLKLLLLISLPSTQLFPWHISVHTTIILLMWVTWHLQSAGWLSDAAVEVDEGRMLVHRNLLQCYLWAKTVCQHFLLFVHNLLAAAAGKLYQLCLTFFISLLLYELHWCWYFLASESIRSPGAWIVLTSVLEQVCSGWKTSCVCCAWLQQIVCIGGMAFLHNHGMMLLSQELLCMP